MSSNQPIAFSPASIKLYTQHDDATGADNLQMHVDYEGDFNPNSVAHNVIAYLAHIVLTQSEKLAQTEAAPSLILPNDLPAPNLITLR